MVDTLTIKFQGITLSVKKTAGLYQVAIDTSSIALMARYINARHKSVPLGIWEMDAATRVLTLHRFTKGNVGELTELEFSFLTLTYEDYEAFERYVRQWCN